MVKKNSAKWLPGIESNVGQREIRLFRNDLSENLNKSCGCLGTYHQWEPWVRSPSGRTGKFKEQGSQFGVKKEMDTEYCAEIRLYRC